MSIVVILVSLLMVAGGIIPNIGGGTLQQQLDSTLNHPEHLQVRIHPYAPSFSLLDGDMAYVEVDAKRFTLLNSLPIESLQIGIETLHLDREHLRNGQLLLESPTQAVVKLQITETGLNQFVGSPKMQQLIETIKKSNPNLAIDADINDIQIDLREDRVIVKAIARTFGGFFTVPLEISGHFRLHSESQLFLYEAEALNSDRPVAGDLIHSLLEQINPILDLKKLSTPDFQLFFREFSIRNESLFLTGEVQLKKITLPPALQ